MRRLVTATLLACALAVASCGGRKENEPGFNVFTPEAFQYFLPAFMFASIDSYDKHDIIPDSIRYHLEFNLEHREYFNVRMSKFSPAQKRVITEFLRQMESRGAGSSY